MQNDKRRQAVILLGAGLWVAVIFAVANSVYQIVTRGVREGVLLNLELGDHTGLRPGDNVFCATSKGLSRVGEVRSVEGNGVVLSVEPQTFSTLGQGTRAVCWRTPLSAEEAITALLPASIQNRVVTEFAESWRRHEGTLVAAWKPIASDLTVSFLQVVGDDLQNAVRLREPQFEAIADTAADTVATRWPAIQTRLNPILERHLLPVVSRLMNKAIDDAPKIAIGWKLLRGHTAEAIEQMLEWLADYLAALPPSDRQELRQAVQRSWEAARADAVLVELVSELGRELRDDERLHRVLADIYREAVADNPQTAEFIRIHILESPEVHQHLYEFVELFGPTARRVAALCLFDESGTTRPEVVHLVRSIALGRDIAWVTLEPTAGDTVPLAPGATLAGITRGDRR